MRVLGNNIIIKAEEATESSVIITDSKPEPTGYADVVLVGNEVSEVEVGDRIYYNNRSGRFIMLDKVEHLMITEHDVFIILGD